MMKGWTFLHLDLLEASAVFLGEERAVRVRFGRVYEYLRNMRPSLYSSMPYRKMKKELSRVLPIYKNAHAGKKKIKISRSAIQAALVICPLHTKLRDNRCYERFPQAF